jgi:hypothetical protein
MTRLPHFKGGEILRPCGLVYQVRVLVEASLSVGLAIRKPNFCDFAREKETTFNFRTRQQPTTKSSIERDGFPTNSYDLVRRWHCQRCDPPSPKGLHGPNQTWYCSVRIAPTADEITKWAQLLICTLFRTVHTGMAKNKRQPYAVSEKAGHQTSAESWGTGQ